MESLTSSNNLPHLFKKKSYVWLCLKATLEQSFPAMKLIYLKKNTIILPSFLLYKFCEMTVSVQFRPNLFSETTQLEINPL